MFRCFPVAEVESAQHFNNSGLKSPEQDVTLTLIQISELLQIWHLV